MTRKTAVIIVALLVIVLVLLLAAGLALMRFPALIGPAPITIMTPIPTAQTTAAASPAVLHIYINGAVMVPGVYEFPPGALVDDALRAAGGFAPGADTRHLNLAQSLVNEMHIYVPSMMEAVSPPPLIELPAATAELQLQRAGDVGAAGLVNINTAGLEELQELPGIGPTLAQRIIDYRLENGPFADIADIQDVSGIGPARFEELESLITVVEADAP